MHCEGRSGRDKEEIELASQRQVRRQTETGTEIGEISERASG